ncbi:hypothetical protein OXX80_006051 [Metschnikowia pulcherrima]
MISLRRFSTAAPVKAAFFARTTLAPRNGFAPSIPTGFSPKSALFLSTPQNLSTTIENAIFLHQQLGLQIVVAGVDRIVPNGASNGVSELWMEESMKLGQAVLLASKDSQPSLRESDGINPVGAKVHWKHVEGSLRLEFQQNKIDLSLANTAFATSTLTTLFFFQKQSPGGADPHMGQTLSELHVKLPELTPNLQNPASSDRWTPLTQEQDLIITKCTGNLVKGINGQPAAQYLEKNNMLMSIASKDTKVYVKVYEQDSARAKKYEVIAGGGGWGAKANLLAISPEAQLAKGDRLEFFMVTPSDRYARLETAMVSRQFRFECAPEATSYEDTSDSSQSVEHLFGAGSEAGFVVNGVNYRSAGESITFAYGNE